MAGANSADSAIYAVDAAIPMAGKDARCYRLSKYEQLQTQETEKDHTPKRRMTRTNRDNVWLCVIEALATALSHIADRHTCHGISKLSGCWVLQKERG
jgi:hypothetical protein